MDKLERELRSRKVPEPEDILAEYRRHFEYKLADGYSEEETAARLGDPAELAAQFEPGEAQEARGAGSFGRSLLTWTGLVFADIFVLSFFIMFASWVLVVACAALSSGLVGLCLLVPFDMQPYVQLPEMPYQCAVLYALALLALAVLAAAGCGYFARAAGADVEELFPFPPQRGGRGSGKARTALRARLASARAEAPAGGCAGCSSSRSRRWWSSRRRPWSRQC